MLDQHEDDRRLSLYRLGLGDVEIGAQVGAKPNTITQWRRKRRLPYLPPRGSIVKLSAEAEAGRLLLYELGWNDVQIAKHEGVIRETIRTWRQDRNLPARNGRGGQRKDKPATSLSALLPRVKKAIGRGLSADLTDDAISEMLVALFEGRLAQADIEREARRYTGRVIGQYASGYGPRSLDEMIGADNDFRLIDTIRDQSADAWLEEMGATWY